MENALPPEAPAEDAGGLLVEALSREDGKTSTVRVYPDRIEWIKQQSISSLPRSKDDPPVIPLSTVTSVKARKDGPLFSKVLVRTQAGTVVFRMYSPQAVEVRDAIADALAAGPLPMAPSAPVLAPDPADDDLRHLESLRDEGLLTAEQFEAAKAALRSR